MRLIAAGGEAQPGTDALFCGSLGVSRSKSASLSLVSTPTATRLNPRSRLDAVVLPRLVSRYPRRRQSRHSARPGRRSSCSASVSARPPSSVMPVVYVWLPPTVPLYPEERIRREVIAAWSEDRAWRHREPVADPGCRIRPADLPPADVHRGGRRVEQFDELVVAAVRPSYAELVNDNTGARLRAKTRLVGHGHEHQRRSDRRGNEQPFDHRTSRAGN